MEHPVERDKRVMLETAAISKARAQIAAGEGLDDDRLEVWLATLDADPDAPLPPASRVVHPA